MPTVSLSFLLVITAVAAASGVLNLVAPNPVYEMAALLLALYAIHGLGLRIALREKGRQEIHRQLGNLRAELEQERARLEVERAERSALEQQWIGLPGRRRALAADEAMLRPVPALTPGASLRSLDTECSERIVEMRATRHSCS